MTGWTAGEKNLVADAAVRAPPVHDTLPWVLELPDGGRVAELYERFDRAPPHHDPLGRDRLISCGAALEHVRIAVRLLGFEPEVALFPEPGRRDLVARVRAVRRRVPTDTDTREHAAIRARHSHRKPFGPAPVADRTVRWLVAANHTDGTAVRPVQGADEVRTIARLLVDAAHVLRGYRRELTAWTVAPHEHGVAAAWRRTGLSRRTATLPDVETLAARMARERLLLVVTPEDGPKDHVLAGAAAETVWLAAVGAGLAGALVTQPFQVSEVRAGLVAALSLDGCPQVLLRLGWRNAPRPEE